MFSNFFTVALRQLAKNRLYSVINVAGLSIGLAACVLILLFVRDELSYDSHWSKADRLARLHAVLTPPGREPFDLVAGPGIAKQSLAAYFAEDIAAVTRFSRLQPVIEIGDRTVAENVVWTDPETIDMFDFTVMAGSMADALRDTSSIALSSDLARRLFGHIDVIGEVMTMTAFNINRDYRIAAIYEAPDHTVTYMPALTKIDEADFTDSPWLFDRWFSINTHIFMELKEGASLDGVNRRLKSWTDATVPREGFPEGVNPSDVARYTLMKITDLRLHASGDGEYVPGGSIETVVVFSAIAGLILMIACINFMNLATAKSTQRAREVALRKVLGAHRSNLVLQFLGESALVAVIALLIAIALVEASLPAFSGFVGKDLSLDLASGQVLGLLLGLILTVGLVAGFYPALILSGFRPARVLKANRSSDAGGSATLRGVLVVMQFAISIALIIATGVVYGQKVFATSLNPGFNKDNVLIVENIRRRGAETARETLREQVAALPGVLTASLVAETPANSNDNNTNVELPGRSPDDTTLIGIQIIDYDFLETFQIELVAGRAYDRNVAGDVLAPVGSVAEGDVVNGNVLVNRTALRKMGYPDTAEAIGKPFSIGRGRGGKAQLTIVGIVPDMHYQSLKRVIRPEMYLLDPTDIRNMAVRFEGDPRPLVERIGDLWRTLAPLVPFEYHFVDEMMASEFETEEATATMLALFSLLAVLIACLGLFGLASFTAQRRTKEIGIRKVLGARVSDIVRLLLWQSAKPVLIANLIAWPVAVWAMMIWLETFPYRLNAWVMAPLCLGAGLVALAIAWATVGGNAARVAGAKPVKALRYE